MYRMAEGIRLHRLLPGSTIVFSGGGAVDGVSSAKAAADLARALGVNANEMILEERSETTAEEAQTVRGIVGDDPFILVTSAVHMPRAMTLFYTHGMRPIPAPTEYRSTSNGAMMIWPSLANMGLANATAHEVLGLGWAWLRGEVAR
jgi:uncharacterized SAM-binding protein YcdF (DUF218 family)